MTMANVTLAAAQTIINAGFEKGAELGLAPLTIAVLDAGGHIVLLARQDESAILRPQLANSKAYGALAIGVGTRWHDSDARQRPHFIQGLIGVAGGHCVPVAGGVLIRDPETNTVMGAVGVTGETSDNDEICAIHGIQAAELIPDAGQASTEF